MYKDKTVCVVVPAFNEERLIEQVVGTVPSFVDHIVVVDDASTDGTYTAVKSLQEEQGDRLVLFHHDSNQGVGGARVTGFKWALGQGTDVIATMDADGQMDPSSLEALVEPVADGVVDYAKGNRLFSGEAWQRTPKLRYLGNAVLSLLTKIASGYWHIADSQTGYTAINRRMLQLVNWDAAYKRYGCPNDYLVRLNVLGARVRDVPIDAIYDSGQRSSMKVHRVIPRIAWLLAKLFVWRLWQKYVIRDFHPLVFFYLFGLVNTIVSLFLFCRLIVLWCRQGNAPALTALALGIFSMMAVLFTVFAMWFDMEENRHLRG